jgi:hypothetical protein
MTPAGPLEEESQRQCLVMISILAVPLFRFQQNEWILESCLSLEARLAAMGVAEQAICDDLPRRSRRCWLNDFCCFCYVFSSSPSSRHVTRETRGVSTPLLSNRRQQDLLEQHP